jgi:hypothetical protein
MLAYGKLKIKTETGARENKKLRNKEDHQAHGKVFKMRRLKKWLS